MITVPEFKKRKLEKQKLTMITCYDSTFAKIVADSPIDTILIGDSSSMVMEGYPSTIFSTLESIARFTASVARASECKKFIVADFPFLVIRKNKDFVLSAAGDLLKAGAHAIKVEGIDGNVEMIKFLVESGIPVMGHLGLTPQFVNSFGGMKVQGRHDHEKLKILKDAQQFENSGAFALVLECIPSALATEITDAISIPTIGIGAGPNTDGQVLVLQDMLGLNPGFSPKFLKKYADLFTPTKLALEEFHKEVLQKQFPTTQESYQ